MPDIDMPSHETKVKNSSSHHISDTLLFDILKITRANNDAAKKGGMSAPHFGRGI